MTIALGYCFEQVGRGSQWTAVHGIALMFGNPVKAFELANYPRCYATDVQCTGDIEKTNAASMSLLALELLLAGRG